MIPRVSQIYRRDNSGKLLGSVREFWGTGK